MSCATTRVKKPGKDHLDAYRSRAWTDKYLARVPPDRYREYQEALDDAFEQAFGVRQANRVREVIEVVHAIDCDMDEDCTCVGTFRRSSSRCTTEEGEQRPD